MLLLLVYHIRYYINYYTTPLHYGIFYINFIIIIYII